MAKKITKQELKSPDAFLKTMQTGMSFTARYGKPLAVVVVLAILIAIGWVSANLIHEHRETVATEALFAPQYEYQKLHDQFEQAKAPQDPKSTVKYAAASGDIEKDYGQVITGLKQVMDQHKGTVAAGQASIYLASIYEDYGKYDDAKSVLEKTINDTDKSSLIYSLTHMVYGNILASEGDCKNAVASFAAVKDFLSVDADVKAGICYEKLGQLDQAAEMYRKASTDSESSTSLAAKGFLKALEQKRQAGQPANQAG